MDQTTELRCSFIRRRMSWGAGASQTRSIRNWTATKSSGTSSLFIEHATTNSRQDFRLAPNDRGSLGAIGYGAGAPCGHARVITPSWHARNIGDGLPLRLRAGEALVAHRPGRLRSNRVSKSCSSPVSSTQCTQSRPDSKGVSQSSHRKGHCSCSNHARLNACILCPHTRAWQALGITRTARELRRACPPVRIDLETDLRCRPCLACRWAERGANAELQALTICCLRERAAPPAPAALAHGRSAAADRVHRGRLQPRATGLPSGATALLQRHDHGLRRRRVPIALALWRSQISSRSCLNLLGVGLP